MSTSTCPARTRSPTCTSTCVIRPSVIDPMVSSALGSSISRPGTVTTDCQGTMRAVSKKKPPIATACADNVAVSAVGTAEACAGVFAASDLPPQALATAPPIRRPAAPNRRACEQRNVVGMITVRSPAGWETGADRGDSIRPAARPRRARTRVGPARHRRPSGDACSSRRSRRVQRRAVR